MRNYRPVAPVVGPIQHYSLRLSDMIRDQLKGVPAMEITSEDPEFDESILTSLGVPIVKVSEKDRFIGWRIMSSKKNCGKSRFVGMPSSPSH